MGRFRARRLAVERGTLLADVVIPRSSTMPSHDSRGPTADRSARPAVDEWGIYDPSQAGLAALFDRLDEKRPLPAETEGVAVAASMRDASKLAKR